MRPFFVYGTLLPDQPNFDLWAHAITQTIPATVADMTLYSMGHYPMMVREPDAAVHGALIEIDPAHYAQILERIDQLENYDPANPSGSLYRRVKVLARAGATATEAWAYIGRHAAVKGKQPIGADWPAHSAENQRAIDVWWQRYNATGQTDLTFSDATTQ